ncbi:MAG: M56 family metallopeptidase, partial [Clostridiaceae bacterium]
MTEIFRTVLNMSITGGIIALAVLLLRIPLKRAPRWITCALWMVVFLRLAVPVSFSSQLSLLSGIGAPAPENGAVAYFSTDTASPANHAIDGITNDSQTLLTTESFSQSANSLAPTPQASADPMQIWLAIGTIIWLIGMAGLLLYAAIQYLRLHKQVRDAVRTELDVFETDAVAAPFVMGIFKPRIILPIGMKSNERESVLLHERAHIYRLDHVVKPVAFLILTLHWFNPIVWLAFRLFCDDLEASCDERAIRALDREKIAIYGEALLRLGTRKMAFSGGPLAFGEHCTKERIVNVLNYKKPAFWIVAAALLASGATAIILLANPLVPPRQAVEPTVKELDLVDMQPSAFEQQTFDITEPRGNVAGGNVSPQVDFYIDLSLLGDKSVSAETVVNFANQLANGQNYIQTYLKKNAECC